jgi:hypothetical protein
MDAKTISSDNCTIRCSFCQCGCVSLRWRQALLLHLDRADVGCALDCLRDVLQRPACGLALGDGPFCASYAKDGYYYLLCRENIVLRLSEEEARKLQSELSSANEALGLRPQPAPARVM